MKNLFATIGFFLVCLALHGQSAVMLAWDQNLESACVGYKILTGTAPRTYTVTNTVMARANTSGIVSNVPSGKVFFTVVAFDASGLDSDFSNEVTWTNRLSAPQRFRLTGTMQASTSPTGPWKDLAQVDVPLPPLVDKQQQFYRTKLTLEELPALP